MNIPRLLFTLLSIGIIGFFGCKNKDNVSTDPNARLSFSVDTLHFDTVFTTLSSITRNFKVYNRGTETVNISSIKLEGGSNSYYNININ